MECAVWFEIQFPQSAVFTLVLIDECLIQHLEEAQLFSEVLLLFPPLLLEGLSIVKQMLDPRIFVLLRSGLQWMAIHGDRFFADYPASFL
jgi:hypothetical protein